jgi:hypothetical protein
VTDGGGERDRLQAVSALAIRLLRGEVIRTNDERGRRWHADATSLHLIQGERSIPILENVSAYDVALMMVATAARIGAPRE